MCVRPHTFYGRPGVKLWKPHTKLSARAAKRLRERFSFLHSRCFFFSIGTYAPLCLFKMMQCRLLWMECTSKCDCVKSMKRAPNAIILRDVFAARFLLWMCSRPEIRLFKHGAHRFVQRARFCLTELTDALECAQMDDTTASNQTAAEIWEEKPSCCRLIGSFSPYNEDFSVLVSPRTEILQKMSASNSIFCNNCCQTLHHYWP
jgi:hypothetical protein